MYAAEELMLPARVLFESLEPAHPHSIPRPAAALAPLQFRAARQRGVIRRYLVAAALVAGAMLLSLAMFHYQQASGWTRVTAPPEASSFGGVVRPATETTVAADTTLRIAAVMVEPGQSVTQGAPLFTVEDREAQQALPAARLEAEDARLQVVALEASLGALEQRRKTLSSRLTTLDGQLDVAERRVAAVPTPQLRESTARAQAAFDQAELRLRRLRDLFAQGVIARQQVEEAETALTVANDDLQTARRAEEATSNAARTEESRATLRGELAAVELRKARLQQGTDLERARIRLQKALATVAALEARVSASRIVAPVGGLVADIRVSRGDVVKAGDVLARVADVSRLVADVQVPTREVPHLHRGGDAAITISAATDIREPGRIRSIEPLPGPNGLHRVLVGFDAPRGVMLSGQSATVLFPPDPAADAVGTTGSSR